MLDVAYKNIIIGTLAILAVVAIIGTAAFYTFRPQQEQVTDDILREKTSNESTYLDFIAENMVGGGPPKDGIPSIDDPQWITPQEAEEEGLLPDDQVFGFSFQGQPYAVSREILYWHEIVNLQSGDEKISVTYCPLTASIIGYEGRNLGVSGNLYNSNLVMYDRATDSRIPQILGKAVDGPLKGQDLETFPVEVTRWMDWKAENPETKVLSRNTGYDRTYDNPPYEGYDDAYRLWFPVAAQSDEFHTKRIIHGVEHKGQAYAIVKEHIEGRVIFAEGELEAWVNETLGTIEVRTSTGDEPKHFDTYWFAWYAYHPDTKIVNNEKKDI